MFSQSENLFRELNVLQKFSGLEDAWNIVYSSQKYMMFLISSCKKNTFLINRLHKFWWERFGKLMEYTKFPTKNYIMYPLVRYSFCKNSSKTSCIFDWNTQCIPCIFQG